ncbi:MAG TPA: hypothetical protein VK763_01670 [Terriglobales bacterium]|jgi:hypothetical protein|nr:hypothetical protein [Terriglobales bacterium]
MSTSPLRAAMVPTTRRFRAYFAPVNRATEAPTLFDPGKYGVFPLDQPPSPWIDLGWIDNFQRFCGVPTQPVRAGKRGAPVSQFRGVLDARLEFNFREWGKLQMALAGGSEHMNVLASNPNANPQPSGGTPILAAAVLTGSTANEIVVGVGVVDGFAVGDMIAVDSDYAQQTGYVGTGISAAYVEDPLDVNRDVNYIRRVTFNLGRVAQTTATSLVLAQSLLGGTPPSNAGVQQVVAFVDREGGTFFQEWSALFVAEDESGGRVCLHYPRLSPTTAIETSIAMSASSAELSVKAFQREQAVEIAKPITALALHAAFQAMPHVDENDGQIAVCYRSYFPALMAAVY